MTIALESMAVSMPEVEGHPNRMDFRGVLTVVDVASQRAPAGSGGKRVLLTRKAAEAAMPSLLGMALDYAPTFDRHDVRRKVGIITSADLVGRKLEVGGYLFAKDFPEVVDEVGKSGGRNEAAEPSSRVARIAGEGAKLRTSLAAAVEEIRSLIGTAQLQKKDEIPSVLRAEADGHGGTGLGMSFEVTNVNVLDRRSKIWTLTNVTFTGAAILRKDKAAYQDTWIELK